MNAEATPQVTGLSDQPKVGGVDLAWGVSTTSYLTGFDVLTEIVTSDPAGAENVTVSKREQLPATARSVSLTLAALPSRGGHARYRYNVRAIVEVGGATIEGDPLQPPADGKVTIARTLDKMGVIVTSHPADATEIKFARLKADGTGTLYEERQLPLLLPYVPPAGYPIVDAQAQNAKGEPLPLKLVNTWAGRLTVLQGSPEPPPVEPPPHTGTMSVGLDTGGWTGARNVADQAACVKVFRSEASHWASDAAMTVLADAGVRLMPLFNRGGDIGSIDAGSLAAEVVQWMSHYGRGGTFWHGRPVDLGATTVEIVNEPGNPYMGRSDGEHSQAAYAAILNVVVKATASLVHPPLILASYDGGFKGDTYGAAVVAAGGFADPRVRPTVHTYGGHGDRAHSALGGRGRVEQAWADLKRQVFVTEVGWPTDTNAGPTGDSLQWTEDEQVRNIQSYCNWARSSAMVDTVIYFNYADYPPNNWYGIVNGSGTGHKQSYAALHAESLK